jgi:adenine-specific DNA-methyltransferase
MTQENFKAAHGRVRDLVADFRRHEAHYLSAKYQEQDVRKDFIDKFWIALGWDVNHETQKNPNEQEVKVERTVGVEGRAKKADYAFLAPNFRDVRFFVEAKKPARNIDNADDYFQTVRYGWNAQAPVSVLTDFEQFRVLDCRLKPDVRTALEPPDRPARLRTLRADAGRDRAGGGGGRKALRWNRPLQRRRHDGRHLPRQSRRTRPAFS